MPAIDLRPRFVEALRSLNKARKLEQTDPQSAAYLSGYTVVLISGIMEDCAEDLVCERVRRHDDRAVESLVRGQLDSSFRSPALYNFNNVVKALGEEYHGEFLRLRSPRSITALQSLITNRTAIAHDGKPSTLTQGDVRGYLEGSRSLLEAFACVLRLPLNINSADKRDLMYLPRIGDTYSQRVIADRDTNGPFQGTEELLTRGLIPDSVFRRIENLITIRF